MLGQLNDRRLEEVYQRLNVFQTEPRYAQVALCIGH